MIDRRKILQGAAVAALAGTATAGYAVAEPWRLRVTHRRIQPAHWPVGHSLRLAVLADLHVCEPWMPLSRLAGIVEATNELAADAVLLLGDFVTHHRFVQAAVPHAQWARELARLKAPLGVHAIQGNHDWWEDIDVQRRRAGTTKVYRALLDAGIPVYENSARRLVKNGRPFWIAGLGDQWAFYGPRRRNRSAPRFGFQGVDDLPATLAAVTDDAPVILMIHEPDAFARLGQERDAGKVAVTLAGHTHGGQITLAGLYAPVVPSEFGQRFVYGHIIEDGRHLVVSGGLGCSGVPLRFGSPPEIVVVELSA